eukprot:scaffold118476_cov63-Phaeocystis_antarctica.AAC.1
MRPTALVAAAVPCRWAGATQHGSRAAYNWFFWAENLESIFGPRCRVAPFILQALPFVQNTCFEAKTVARNRFAHHTRAGRGAARRGPPSTHTAAPSALFVTRVYL